MQPRQNALTYNGETSSPFTTSPLTKLHNDFPFKSPLTSAQKKKFFRNKNDSAEHEHNNPFSGPLFAPVNDHRDRFSPFSFTPIKVKEEFSLGDFTGGSKDHNLLAKPYESPYTTFCKDLSFSPGPYNIASPSTLLMRLHHGGGLPNNAYSPMFDNRMESPMFAKKNITRLDFNNPNKYIMLKSYRDEISIEADDQADLVDLHKDYERNRFALPQNTEEVAQPSQLRLPSKRSIYANSMVPSQTKNKEIFSQKSATQDSNSRVETASNTRGAHNNEDEEHPDLYAHESLADRYPRTPSPQAHNSKNKIKLENINSFSEQARRIDRSQTGQDMGSENSEDSMGKEKMTQGEVDELEEFCVSKMKKKICCNCKKSRCLKLYCDCFGRGIPCAKECNCINCLNTESHVKERNEAMRAILERNPSAFKPKIDRTESPEKVEVNDQGRVRHMKGCNCKKSGCLKRYCECYQAGVKCTEMCKCENCKNMDNCCRFKRAQNYGLINFGSQESIGMNMVYSDSKPIKQHKKQVVYKDDEDVYEEDDETLPYNNSQIRLVKNYQDPRYFTELPPSKKRKMNVSVSDFTPKRTLVFPKPSPREEDEEQENDYPIHMYREKKKGTISFRAPFPHTEKKKIVDKNDKDEDYTPSPGKPTMSGRRARRAVRPFSHFNSDEYELRK